MSNYKAVFNPTNRSPPRNFKPLLRPRGDSSSSEVSAGSLPAYSPGLDDASEDQFVFSVGNTPAGESPKTARSSNRNGALTSAKRLARLSGKQPATSVISEIKDPSTSARSKPIAIELPIARRVYIDSESAPADTPPEPLSARGDIPGGYFPFHEDPSSRVRRPHPFHLDANKVKDRSVDRAAASSSTTAPPVLTLLEPAPLPIRDPFHSNPTMSGSHTPVSSYIPNGVHETGALPLGKYYPSNYERRMAGGSESQLRSTMDGAGPAIKSQLRVPMYRREAPSTHARANSSDLRRRLLQYQRDMVAQATVAASALLANREASGSDGTTRIPRFPAGFKLPTQLGKDMAKTHNPASPRLEPLGSPGPVTPMTLEASEGFVDRSAASNDDFERPSVEHVEYAEGYPEQEASATAEGNRFFRSEEELGS